MTRLEADLRSLATEFQANSDSHYSGWTIYLIIMGLLSRIEEDR